MSFRLATYNVLRMEDPIGVNNFLTEHNIDVCGMQEVAGESSLKKLKSVKSGEFGYIFDNYKYKTYGNGLVYRKSKFVLKSTETHQISEGEPGGIKTLLKVELLTEKHDKIYTIYVTHLHHKNEHIRLKQIQKIKSIISPTGTNAFLGSPKTNHNIPHFLLGDFNSLTKSDYTEEEWKNIEKIRLQNNWEPPLNLVSEEMSKSHFDCLPPYRSTCKYNSRIDYIFCTFDHKKFISNVKILDEVTASDHKPVICDVLFEELNIEILNKKCEVSYKFIDTAYRYGFHVKKLPSLYATFKSVFQREVSAMQLFVSNPKSKYPPSFDLDDLKAARELLERYQEMYVVIHGCLLYNLAGSVEGNDYQQSLLQTVVGLVGELDYAVALGRPSGVGVGVIIHPGSRKNKDEGHKKVAETMIECLTKKSRESVILAKSLGISQDEFIKRRKIIIENSAGEGSKLCSTLKEIKSVIDLIPDNLKDQVRVCIDSAHAFGSSMCDWGKDGEIQKFYDNFDRIIGLKYLEVFHFNDSKVKFGSQVDRHENLGLGYIFTKDNPERYNNILTFVQFAKKHGIAMIGEPPGEGKDDWQVVKSLTANTSEPLEFQ